MRIAIENNDNKNIKKMSGSITIMRIWERLRIIVMKIMANILLVLKGFIFAKQNIIFNFLPRDEMSPGHEASLKVKYGWKKHGDTITIQCQGWRGGR